MKLMNQFLVKWFTRKQCVVLGMGIAWVVTGLTMGIAGCKTAGTTAYTAISVLETSVTQANLAFLDGVVTGTIPTNSVPTVERAYNDMQMALRAAAAVASGGSSAAAPATLMVQATAFTNTINQATGKVK